MFSRAVSGATRAMPCGTSMTPSRAAASRSVERATRIRDGAAGRAERTGEDPQQRRLAGARRPGQRRERARGETEGDVVEDPTSGDVEGDPGGSDRQRAARQVGGPVAPVHDVVGRHLGSSLGDPRESVPSALARYSDSRPSVGRSMYRAMADLAPRCRPGGQMLAALRYRRAQTIVVVVLSALVTTCLVLAPLYTRALEQAMVRTMLRDASAEQTGLRLSSTSQTEPAVALDPDDLEQLPPETIRRYFGAPCREHRDRRPADAAAGRARRTPPGSGRHVRAREVRRGPLPVGPGRDRGVERPGQGVRDRARGDAGRGRVRRGRELARGRPPDDPAHRRRLRADRRSLLVR